MTISSFYVLNNEYCTRIGEISGLHKMWRSRSQDDVLGRVANEILPFLGSYADILIEGALMD
jgi:hypothetical protein